MRIGGLELLKLGLLKDYLVKGLGVQQAAVPQSMLKCFFHYYVTNKITIITISML